MFPLNAAGRNVSPGPARLIAHIGALCLGAFLALPMEAQAQDQRAILDVVVNGVPGGESVVTLRGNDILIGVSVLANAGLRGFAGRRELVDAEEVVSLASLEPALTYVFSERDLRLAITAGPELLGERVRNLRAGEPPNLVFRRDTSGFVNYALGWTGGDQGDLYDVFTESALSVRGALLHTTVSATSQAVTRGLSSVTMDERSRLRRWVVGDSFAHSGVLGGGAFIAGINISRDFGVDPYFVRNPSLSVATPVTAPSVVEVHVNGRLVSQEQVGPGYLNLQNLPLTTGQNDARVVVRDPFGGTREFSTHYYLSTSVLAPGVHDYQYSVGWQRESLGSESWSYTVPALLARHRVGLTSFLTAGGRVDAASGIVSGGPAVNLRLPVGEIEAAGAFSRSPQGRGTASSMSYAYTSRPVGAGASFRQYSETYATVGSSRDERRPLQEASAFVNMPIAPRTRLTVQQNHTKFSSAPPRVRSGLVISAPVNRRATLSVSAARVRDEHGRNNEFFAGITVPFGRTVVAASRIQDAFGRSNVVEGARSLPLGIGYGYQFKAETGSHDIVTGVAQYQGAHGRYEVRREMLNGQQTTTVQVAGALVGIGGGVHASRPVRSSFALLRVPGVKGVRGFASHQEVGRTNAKGDLLVPDLEPYYGNILNIADQDIPLDYSVAGNGLTLAPPFRGGALAVFSVRHTRRIVGRILVASPSSERAPTYGQLTVTAGGERIVSPVGAQGEFYFENLPDGLFAATVEDKDGSCAFTLMVPDAGTPFLDLGTIWCSTGER